MRRRAVVLLTMGALLSPAWPAGAQSEPTPPPDATERPFWDLSLQLGALSLRPRAQVQVQGAPLVGDDAFVQAGDAADNEGFRLRRGRFGLRGDIAGWIPFAVSVELVGDAEANARLLDAWVGYARTPYLQLYAGAMKIPFSRSALVGSGQTALIERPFAVRAMAPFRQVGIEIEGHLWNGALSYHAGVYNGLQRSDQFYGGFVENSASLGNRFDELAYAARLTTEPLGPIGDAIEDLDGSDLRLGLGVGYVFSNGGTRDAHLVGADALLHFAGAHLLAEFLWSEVQPEREPTQETSLLGNVSSMAAVVEAGYVLLHRIGLAVRFEWLDPNTDVDDASDQWVVTGGVSYHFIRNVFRIQADYTHREEIHGPSLDNDVLLLQLQLYL